MTGIVNRSLIGRVALTASLLGAQSSALAAQARPDSVVLIEPIMVRVLGSTIGTQAPYPVSVVSGSELTRGSTSTFIEEALRAVPGVQIQNRFNLAVGERIAVRGFGPRSQFGVRGVRILVDGIPATLPDGQATLDHLYLAGLGRVEALRGPNAALYGNAAGGVLHFQTLDPAESAPEATLRWTGGTLGSSVGGPSGSEVAHDLWTLEGTVTGRSGSNGYRVGFSHTDMDGFRRDPVADDGSAYGAATRSVVNGTLSRPLSGGTLRVVANGVNMDAENPGSLPQAVLDEGNRAAWGSNVSGGLYKDVKQGQIGTSWAGPVGATTGEFAVWGIRRELYNPIPGAVVDLNRNAGGFRSLFRGSRPIGDAAFQWGGGVEVELQKDGRLNYENNGGVAGDVTLDQTETVRGAGLFVQGRLDVGGAVSLLTGLRYDNIAFSVDDDFTAAGDPDDSGDRTLGAISPSAGVVVAAAEGLEVFASLGRSFETPTTTELANRPSGAGGFNPDLDPQKGTTLEGGARATIADRARVELSVFRTKIRNGLVSFQVPSAPGRDFYRNAARATHTGWEASVDGSIAPRLTGRVAYTDIDAEYDFYETATDDYSGNKVAGLAPRRLDGLLTYDAGTGYVEVRGLWEDQVPVDDGASAYSPSYFVGDVRLGLEELPVQGLFVSPFFGISNLFDETYNASVVPNAFGGRFYEPGPGRTFRVGAGVTWRGSSR